MQKSTYKILVDTSVLLAAYGSETGASNLILSASGKRYICLISENILEEYLSKYKKFSTSKSKMINWIQDKDIFVVENTEIEELEKFNYFELKDRHVIATAKKFNVDILLSLDKKHILIPGVKKALSKTLVLSPKEFLVSKPIKLL